MTSFPAAGEKPFFDLAKDSALQDRVRLWRERLIEVLGERGDGFSDGKRLPVRKAGWGRWGGELMRRAGGLLLELAVYAMPRPRRPVLPAEAGIQGCPSGFLLAQE